MQYKIPRTREHSPLANQLRAMSKEQVDIAMWNVHTIQLTYGCSVGCYFCGCNVPKGVRAEIPVEIVDFFAENFQPQFRLREPYLSGNNDPLDWESKGKDFIYAYNTLTNKDSWTTGLSTAIPPGKENLALYCVLNGYLSRISISSMNKGRLQKKIPKIFELAKKHDIELYYPEEEGLIEIGRNSNGVYEADSLSNRVGTMVTPLGICNINLTHPSARFQTGEIETIIDPNNFKVIEWGRRKDLPVQIWDYWIYGRNGAFPVQLLREVDSQVVDRNIANAHLFLNLFYSIKEPAHGRKNQYLDAAKFVIKSHISGLMNLNPSNEASAQRLEECAKLIPKMVRNLGKKDDSWSRRKKMLLEPA